MATPRKDGESDQLVAPGLYLRLPANWQVQSTPAGTQIFDPHSRLKLQVYCKPSLLAAVSLPRFGELGMAHLLKTRADLLPQGAWQIFQGQGWHGRWHLLWQAVGAQGGASMLIYAVLILADDKQPTLQNNISILLEIDELTYQERADYFRCFLSQRLRLAAASAPQEAAVPSPISLQDKPAQPEQQAGVRPSPPGDRVEAALPAETDEAEGEARLQLLARGQKLVIYAILGNFALNAMVRSEISVLLILPLSLALMALCLNGLLKLCSGLEKSVNSKIAFMIGATLPLINIVLMLFLSVKASKILRAAGWKVGLLGARR